MSDFLASMAAASAARAAEVDPRLADAVFDKPVVPLRLGAFDVIAEIKDRSPAEGELSDGRGDRAQRARRYAAGGAAAISVLTEPSRFGGELGHLEEVAAAVPDTPVMRKDFLVDPLQLREARAAGASGVLLIVTMLDDTKLDELLDCAFELGLFVLLESFDAADLGRVATLLVRDELQQRAAKGQLLAGVNARNLRTLEVDHARLAELAPALPDARCVAESGMQGPADAAAAAALGYRLALVGTALMRSEDPGALVAAMRAAGRAEVGA
jgi:indole-3-glycerol phosphate synthase